MEENPPTTDKVIITTITQDEKHTTATDGRVMERRPPPDQI